MWRPDPTEPSSLPDEDPTTPLAIGPEWSEGNSGLYLAELAATLANHGGGETSDGLALDLLLNEIVEQARLATTASGAAIAMQRHGELVCRATTGDNAPDLGVRLNTQSRLSGACVQTQEVQQCDDTEADPRVDAEACRRLNVRSILVVPIVDEATLIGVIEIFSPRPYAFGDRDSQTLLAFSRRIVDSIQTANQAQQPAPEPEPAFPPDIPAAIEPPRIAEVEETNEAATPSLEPVRSEPARDYWTGILTALVIALALLLGWMVGHAGWQQAVVRREARRAAPRPTQTASPQPAAPAQEVAPAPVPAVDERKAVSPLPPTLAKPKTEGQSAGDLSVYDNGKLVFQMATAKKNGEASNADATGGASPTSPSPVSLSSDAASAYLLTRVEPEYPVEAREQHVQGPVVLDVIVGKNGLVRSLTIHSGEPVLAAAAAEAVRQWRFKPFHRRGIATEFETRITVNFALP